MRTFPSGWSDPAAPDQTLPTVYVHLIGSTWPPAAGALPAGYAEVATWNIDAELVGALLAGQVKNPSGLSVATGFCEIAQPSVRLAPWKQGANRVKIVPTVELIASYNGPTGSTAYSLGTFKLNPVSSKQSSPSLTLELVEDWVALRKPHTVVQQRFGFAGGAPIPVDDPENYPYDPARVIEQIADDAGFAHNVDDFGTEITSIYFPGDVDALSCIQQIVAAHLGAVRVNAASEITVLSYEQLAGIGVTPADTLSVLDEFVDLEWVVDPAEAYDRVEVTFTPPDYLTITDIDDETGDDLIALERAMAAWEAAPKTRIEPGKSREYVIDPGTAWSTATEVINSDTKTNGTGTSHYVLDTYEGIGSLTEVSTGRLIIKVQNTTSVRRWLVENDGNPSYLMTYWIDSAGSDDAVVLSWGADAYTARNPLSVDLGKMIQRTEDARLILNRIVEQVRDARPRIPSVNVVPDLRRELGDIVWLNLPEEGLHTKAIISKISNGGQAGQLTQQLELVFLGPRISDFNEDWDAANASATIASFNAFWDALMPTATIADFNENPLAN